LEVFTNLLINVCHVDKVLEYCRRAVENSSMMILASLICLMIFSALCTVDDGVTPALDNRMKNGATLDNIEFNRGTVMLAIKRLKNNTASRP
jgi:hypothetical protein